MTDLVTVGDATLRFSPPRGERIETASEFAAHVGGPESNVSVAAATLGLDAAWLSKLPDTPLGRRIVGELRRHGVRTGVVWTDSGRASTAFVERGAAPGGRTVPDREDAAVATTTADDLPLGAVRDAETLFVSGATPARSETLLETTATLLSVAGEADTTRAFDTRFGATGLGPDRARDLYDHLLDDVDVLIVDETDAEAVFDLDGDVVPAAHSLRTRYDCETVVVTRAERDRPTVGLHGEEIYEVPAFETETRDTAGVHDAFVGGFLAGRHRSDGTKGALTEGAATAALKRTIVGDVVVGSSADVAGIRDDRKRSDR
ncbi:sugar kinase [Haloplanus halophilus]|uniref:sugar kinase n=1 Tax=Haloplanus halophilus TaxID=2949993 RepID=UPI00203C1FD5|nr:sugar kinase [Haloplanus sp. GDY1]